MAIASRTLSSDRPPIIHEGAKVSRADLENTEDVAGHAEEESCSMSIAVGEGVNDGRCDSLEETACVLDIELVC